MWVCMIQGAGCKGLGVGCKVLQGVGGKVQASGVEVQAFRCRSESWRFVVRN